MRTTPGDAIQPNALRSRRAQELAAYATSPRREYVTLIGCTADAGRDIVILELDLSVAQRPKVPITVREPIAVYFNAHRDDRPSFVPLREDFPDDIVHLMTGDKRTPPSLCLWEAPFEELRATLTPAEFVRQLRRWLEKSAEGTLHEADQPLEPVMVGADGIVIVPADPSSERLVLVNVERSPKGKFIIRFGPEGSEKQSIPDGLRYILGHFETPRLKQRAVVTAPSTLADLEEMLKPLGYDLTGALRAWARTFVSVASAIKAIPILLFCFPKVASDDPVEAPTREYWTFCSDRNLQELGIALGLFARAEGNVSQLIVPAAPQLASVQLNTMIVVPDSRREELPSLAGLPREHLDTRVALVGAGALGSTMLEIAARSGFGKWLVADEDILLPHNLVRHVLGGWAVGQSKARALRHFVNQLVPDSPVTEAFYVDVLDAEPDGDPLGELLHGVDVVIDASASVPVARRLATRSDAHRTISAFLSPSGTDLVVLCESKDRALDLWDLEASYYASVAANPRLADHLAPNGQTRRYGNGCRDRTAAISTDAVNVLASIAMRQIMNHVSSPDAFAGLWRYAPLTGDVQFIPLSKGSAKKLRLLDWEVSVSDALIARLMDRRAAKLPNETGGVLIGVVDREHRKVLVVDEIPAPADSTEHPLCFARGDQGLDAEIQRINSVTAQQLRYAGEWHSHPTKTDATPSATDEKLFGGLKEIFDAHAEPYMMVIINDDALYVRLGLDQAAAAATFKLDHQDPSPGGSSSGR